MNGLFDTNQAQHQRNLAATMQRKLIQRLLSKAVECKGDPAWKRRVYMLCYGASLRWVLTGKYDHVR